MGKYTLSCLRFFGCLFRLQTRYVNGMFAFHHWIACDAQFVLLAYISVYFHLASWALSFICVSRLLSKYDSLFYSLHLSNHSAYYSIQYFLFVREMDAFECAWFFLQLFVSYSIDNSHWMMYGFFGFFFVCIILPGACCVLCIWISKYNNENNANIRQRWNGNGFLIYWKATTKYCSLSRVYKAEFVQTMEANIANELNKLKLRSIAYNSNRKTQVRMIHPESVKRAR